MSIHHDRIVRTMLESLAPGCPIVTADGEEIGTLAKIADAAVKVSAPLRRDFWIDADYIRSCDDGRIELSFIKKDLGAYKADSYRHGDKTQPDDPLAEGKQDHIVSDSEQLETRLRMERELAEQRHELPHLHPQGDDAPPDTFGTLGEPVESELARHGLDLSSHTMSEFATAEERTGGHRRARFLAAAAVVISLVGAVYCVRRWRS